MVRPELLRIESVSDPTALPLALADLHQRLEPGHQLEVTMPVSSAPIADGPYPLPDVVEGAGFALVDTEGDATTGPAARETGAVERMVLRRLDTLADTVGPGMAMLICGLNPSPYSAEVGVGFGRPGNRFWPAALKAGLVGEPNDPRRALVDHRVGMTDLVKRSTRRADELSRDEYRRGLDRLHRLSEWLAPPVICFVGLAGWRAAVNRKAASGLQPEMVGGATVYLMPSTSGLNASSSLDDLAEHLGRAKALAG
jgi:TDG/mug DNA glycosylase family protein